MQERAAPPEIVHFDGLLVIVGGGAVDAELLRELYFSGAHLVGADGGADQIVAAELAPEAIIGDFDSVRSIETWLGRARLIRLEEQDTTDFEKALYSTTAPVTVAIGMTGHRFDHTLAALDAVARQARDRRIILVDEHDLALATTGRFEFDVNEGERLSVHPLWPVDFHRSYGLRYPLDGLRLAPGERSGTSNTATDGHFVIEPEVWSLQPWLLVLDRKYLFTLCAKLLAGK